MSLTLEQFKAAVKPLGRSTAERERLKQLLADTDALLSETDASLGPSAPNRERRRSMRRRRGHTYDRAGRPL